jgi:hypothetical protein
VVAKGGDTAACVVGEEFKVEEGALRLVLATVMVI